MDAYYVNYLNRIYRLFRFCESSSISSRPYLEGYGLSGARLNRAVSAIAGTLGTMGSGTSAKGGQSFVIHHYPQPR